MDVKINTEYITLGQLLKLENVIGNGGGIKFFLQSNNVFVNGIREDRRGRKLYQNDVIKVSKKEFKIVK